jgi:release factor glutamine methyltransferase
VDLIVANLPYVRDCEFRDLSPEIREHEPTIALAGGRDGLDKIREMLEQMRGKGGTHCGGPVCLLLEIGQGQGEMVTSLVNNYFPQASIELISDLGGIERVVKVGLSSGGSGLK